MIVGSCNACFFVKAIFACFAVQSSKRQWVALLDHHPGWQSAWLGWLNEFSCTYTTVLLTINFRNIKQKNFFQLYNSKS